MGSTPPAGTPPPLSAKAAARPISGNDQKSVAELSQLLELRDQEIQALKYELDKYKLALQQSQLNYHLMQQQLDKHQRLLAATGAGSSANIGIGNNLSQISSSTGQQLKKQQQQQALPTDIVNSSSAIVDAHAADDSGVINDLGTTNDLLVVSDRSSSVERSTESVSKRTHATDGAVRTAKVLFKTGDDDESDEEAACNMRASIQHSSNPSSSEKNDDNLDELIQDVGEIDLNLELAGSVAGRKGQRAGSAPLSSGGTIDEDENEDEGGGDNDDDGDDDDDEILSDQLLTSLTDAAISNLSQLAALQEQCESQKQHSHKYQPANHSSNRQQQQQQSSRQHSSHSSSFSAGDQSSSVTPVSPQNIAGPMRLIDHHRHAANQTVEFSQDPFSSASISSQAAIAINAAAAAAAACVTSSPMIGSSSCQQQPTSSSSSVSPTSTIQTDLTTSHTLANVVVAAAAAAAAANDQQHQHQHSHMNPPHHQQSRLVSSALPSPDFYQSLHHHHQRQQQQQQLPYHQSQVQHHHSPLPALSSLHFSPSTSITPSPCSIMSTSQSTRRSTTSNASSSIVSPTASPNYLRRQFMPDRMPLMSPSPSSGLATGSSSGASSSLAHLLHHHHHGQQSQQRSASALGGIPLSSSSASGTPLSGTGSSAVSPLMSNKNSSQARLNNMQIRHKFGYLGSGKAQFNSPHGFCLGLNQEIVVADTNNHRVCIFDKSGTYITQFGSPGKEEGQLWNPRKVAILHRPTQQQQAAGSASANQNSTSSFNQRLKSPFSSGHSGASPADSSGQQQLALTNSEPLYVVCDRGAERSRMQLFTKDGAFIKKIGIHYIDIVAGLAITQNGLIIVVDSVSPTVYIINGETGILNGWFDCSGYMKEPSDIAVKSDVPGNEYFICDFKGHCVVVFSEQGDYLRKIGHDGLTSYPNGIDISDDGDILVGDSHGNRFHVVVFDRNGNFVSQFECPHVKVSRCCGLKITREGYIVTLAKNNHHVLVLDTIHI